MAIRIWKSFSCNNSSSFRIVAKFADAATAAATAEELKAFLAAHAAEVDQRDDYSEEPSAVQRDIGERYGFRWSASLYWGDSGLVGDEPDLFVEDNVLIVQHTYCGGGLGDLPVLLEKRGATFVDEKDSSTVDVSIVFRAVPGANPTLDAELATMFEQLESDDAVVEPLLAPWTMGHESYGSVAWFRDAGTVGLYVPLDPRDLPNVKAWLGERAIEKPILTIGDAGNFDAFWAIAKARCSACQAALEYLDPRLHDIETPQLVCKACGGLYDLQPFLVAPR
jgi:hypothetical protein